MNKLAFAILLAGAILLFSGCVQNSAAPTNGAGDGASFVLPPTDVSYHARYTVEEGGPMSKEVWRVNGSMRMDMSVQGMRALSFYFIGNRAYSCSFVSQPTACYDITSSLSQGDASRLVPDVSDVEGATQVESVKMGSTKGDCYDVSMGALGGRKLCFAPQGVMAFDSYNVSKGVVHTEYLTDLEYYGQGETPPEGTFALPAAPIYAPGAPSQDASGFEE